MQCVHVSCVVFACNEKDYWWYQQEYSRKCGIHMCCLKALYQIKIETMTFFVFFWARKMGTSIYTLRVLWFCDVGIAHT